MEALCQCWCGLPAPLAPYNNATLGYVKGQPIRWRRGYNARRLAVADYPKQPNTKSLKRLHVARAESALGKPLPKGAQVHHADGSKRADAQLVICQDQAYHSLLHTRMRIRSAGGNPNIDKICSQCRRVVLRALFPPDLTTYDGLYAKCSSCAPRKWKEMAA